MNAITHETGFKGAASVKDVQRNVQKNLEILPWGYQVAAMRVAGDPSVLRLILARFAGAILVLAGLGLWVMPDANNGADVNGMKFAVTVVFILVGLVLVWAGRQRPGVELQVDTATRELRLGKSDLGGGFELLDRLPFDDVRGVFVAQPARKGEPARLYARLGGDVAVELSHGDTGAMQSLATRLTRDITPAA